MELKAQISQNHEDDKSNPISKTSIECLLIYTDKFPTPKDADMCEMRQNHTYSQSFFLLLSKLRTFLFKAIILIDIFHQESLLAYMFSLQSTSQLGRA